MLCGCDYTVPLVQAPEMDIDPGFVGLWQRLKEDGQAECLLVLPLGKKEYLISFPANSKDAMFARACFCRVAGQKLVQLEWIGTARAKLPESGRVFQFAACTVNAATVAIRLLNADLVQREAKSSRELARAIAANQDQPNLFRDAMVFKLVKN